MKEWIVRINQSRLFLTVNLVAFFFLSNLLGSGLNLRLDMSEDGVNSLSESTKKVLEKIENPILVEAFITEDLPGEIRAILDSPLSTLRALDRAGGAQLDVEYIDPDTPEKMELAEKRGVRGIPIEEQKVDQISQKLAYFGLYVRMGEHTSVISLVEDGRIVENLEYAFLREIKKMMRDSSSSGIAFVDAPGTLSFHPWRSSQDQNKDNLYAFRNLTERELGRFDDIRLEQPVPADIETLILTGLPRLTEQQLYTMDQFLMRGGNLVLMLRSFQFDQQPANPMMERLGLSGQSGGFASIENQELEQLNRWLNRYGLGLNGEILFEPALGVNAMDVNGQYITPVQNPSWAIYSTDTATVTPGSIPYAKSIRQVVFPWYSGIQILPEKQPEVQIETVVRTTANAVRREQSMLGLDEMVHVGKSPGDTRVQTPVPVFVHAKGKFKSMFSADETGSIDWRVPASAASYGDGHLHHSLDENPSEIVLLGTPYLVSDVFLKNEFNQQIFSINQSVLINLLEYLSGDQDLMEARSRVRTLHQLDPVDPEFQTFFTWFFVLLIPVTLSLFGIYHLSRRNLKRQGDQA